MAVGSSTSHVPANPAGITKESPASKVHCCPLASAMRMRLAGGRRDPVLARMPQGRARNPAGSGQKPRTRLRHHGSTEPGDPQTTASRGYRVENARLQSRFPPQATSCATRRRRSRQLQPVPQRVVVAVAGPRPVEPVLAWSSSRSVPSYPCGHAPRGGFDGTIRLVTDGAK